MACVLIDNVSACSRRNKSGAVALQHADPDLSDHGTAAQRAECTANREPGRYKTVRWTNTEASRGGRLAPDVRGIRENIRIHGFKR